MLDVLFAAIREKKIELMCLAVLIGVAVWAVPLAMQQIAAKEVKAIEPVIVSRAKEMIGFFRDDLTEIKTLQMSINENINSMIERQNYDTLERGIAGFNKCHTIQCLEENPNNRINIKNALRLPDGKKFLSQIDHDKAELFISYFFDPDI